MDLSFWQSGQFGSWNFALGRQLPNLKLSCSQDCSFPLPNFPNRFKLIRPVQETHPTLKRESLHPTSESSAWHVAPKVGSGSLFVTSCLTNVSILVSRHPSSPECSSKRQYESSLIGGLWKTSFSINMESSFVEKSPNENIQKKSEAAIKKEKKEKKNLVILEWNKILLMRTMSLLSCSQ